ncbi:unnamed protein product [Staurois parvus]|uniref:Uncharacterized protein n=1 Tax=Staurois parvus TaxID=386267 RepID=A0ABN9ET97_9NEOB|nr:unnamed protein product [Staurois parvus]
MDGLIAQVATYHDTPLEFIELLRATHSFTNVCRSSLHAEVLDFLTPVAMEVIGTTGSNDLVGCHNTFIYCSCAI